MRFVLLPLAVWLVLYAPGHYLLRRYQSGERGPESRLFREVLLSACCTSWLGFTLAELGIYSLAGLLGALAVLSLIGAFLTRTSRARPYGLIDVAAVAVVVLTWLWVSPPLDTRILGADSAGYLASGIHLSRHGSLIIHDPTLSLLSADLKRALFPSVTYNPGAPPYLRLAGSLVLRSLDRDEVLPAFHHLIAVWIAIFHRLGGSTSVQWVVTLFAGLAVWAIAEFTLGLAGGVAAAGLCVILWSCSAQDWYSRFLMPEVPAQLFVWGGLSALFSWSRSARRSDALLAGAAFGIAGLMRSENVPFLLLALALASRLRTVTEDRPLAPLLLPALCLWLHAVLHLVIFRTHYLGNVGRAPVEMLAPFTHVRWPEMGLLAAVVSGLGLWAWRSRASAGRWSSIVPLMMVALFLSLWGDWQGGWSSARLLIAYIGVGTVTIGGAGLMLGALGSAQRNMAVTTFLLLAAVVATQFMLAPHATPVPIWAVRRAVTVIVPALGIGLVLCCRAVARRWHGAVALLAFSLGLATQMPPFRQLRSKPYYQQGWRHIQAVATLLPPGACLLIDTGLTAWEFAPALWAAYDLPAYLVSHSDPVHIAALSGAMRALPVFWIERDTAPPPRVPGVTFVPVAQYQFAASTPALDIGAPRDASAIWDSAIGIYALHRDDSHYGEAP